MRLTRLLYTHIIVFILGMITMLTSLTGCSDPFEQWQEEMRLAEIGGHEGDIIDLPFEAGYEALCTQGAHGEYSHASESTEYDIDLDTPNDSVDLVYAPVGGVAYVHMDSASKNFGYHVNIDRDDGTYVILGHLSDIYVEDGVEVAAGQIVGTEGCTGYCSGDHVHFGLHSGDAASPGERATSIKVSYLVDDVTAGEEGEVYTSEEMICDLEGGGHRYRSLLTTPTWHPNGSLVKTPWDEEVFLIENGTKRWITDQDVFWSLGYSFEDVALISGTELNCYDQGDDVATADEVPTAYTSADGTVTLHEGELVKESSESDVYVISEGVAMPIESWDVLLKLGWGERPITTIDDGTIEEIVGAVGSCAADIWCLDHDLLEACETTNPANVGGSEDTASEEENETEAVDPSSMLEGEIEDGEFGLVFLPPDGYEAEHITLTGTAIDAEGNTLYAERELASENGDTALWWTTMAFEDGGVFDFYVTYTDGMGDRYSCEIENDGSYRMNGTLYMVYGAEVIDIETVLESANGGRHCYVRPRIPPGYTIEIDTGDSNSSGDTGEPTVDTGTATDAEVEICYAPGVTMSGGELYLDGGFFTHWDTSPADTAASGDTTMCETVTAVSGETIKVNGWFIERGGSGTVEWAAYNNVCASIDWQGSVTVDSASVSVTTAPWSAASWASDPCMTGGDGYFTVP